MELKILAIDDEPPALELLVRNIKKAIPDCEIFSYSDSREALKKAEAEKIDIAFTDIHMPHIHGTELAKALKKTNPKLNIIFVTGYSQYQSEAIKLHVSGYISKPVSADDIAEEMENLLNPIEQEKADVYVQTFGNFCIFKGGVPVPFRRKRSQEMLAYLVDRRGSAISRQEIASVLFEESDFSRTEQTYLSNIANALTDDLEAVGIKGLFCKKAGNYFVDTSKFECDSYDYLDGKTDAINRFGGEYMEQYSWAEYMKAKFFES